MQFFSSTSTIPNVSSRDILKNKQKVLGVTQKQAVVTQKQATEIAPNSTSSVQTTSGWSPTLNRVLEEPPASFPQHLTIGAIVFCLTCGVWAWFGTIDEVSKAKGKLIPQGETYKIEPIELGQVKNIAVEEGEKVKAGQTLVELDTELAQQEIIRLEQMLQAYNNELSQKQALREKLSLEAKTSADITKAEALAKQTAISLAEEKVTTFRGLLARQQAEVQAYNTQLTSLESLSTLTKENLNQLEAEKILRQQRLNKLRPLAQQGAISQEYVFQVEQSLRETERQITQSQIQEIANTREQVFQSHQAMRELQARIIQNQGELASAFKEVKKLEVELIQKLAEGKRIQLETQQKIKQIEFELAQINSKIGDTQNLLSAARAKVRQKFLKAPVDGTVLALNLDNSGKVVQAGETVIEIAPEGVPLILSALLPNQEAGFVKEGMPVQVKLDAYPYQYYGLTSGTVTYLSADAKLDPQLGEVYQVEIELERNHVTEARQKVPFKAGQTATADIVVRRRRLIDVWLEPIKKLQQDGLEM